MAGLQKRFNKVGYIKPVGQQHVEVIGSDGAAVRVDKDVELVKEYFKLDHVSWPDMSPVLMPRSYTKRYIDGEIQLESQVEAILGAQQRVSAASDVLLLEGTGHVGVGSVVEMNNAKVASLMGADVVLVANGGIGSSFDELEMNHSMVLAAGARVRGVVLNKVIPDKVEMVREYFGKLLSQRWGGSVALLGVVPDLPFLGKSTLADIERLLHGKLLGGHHLMNAHYDVREVDLVTTGVRRFLRKADYRSTIAKRPLFVTHATRDDIVLAYLSMYKRKTSDISKQPADSDSHGASEMLADSAGAPAGNEQWQRQWPSLPWAGAMILCSGTAEGVDEDEQRPLPFLMEMVRAHDAPVMLVEGGTRNINDRIHSYTAKMHIKDPTRVAAAIEHYEPHIDFDKLLNTM